MGLNSQTTDKVTDMLLAWSNGDTSALGKLMPVLYDELKRLAHVYMKRERTGHTLQTSALVNEAYLKLINQGRVEWQNRAHFIGIAARLMREILIEHARGRQAAKRGGGQYRVSLGEVEHLPLPENVDLIALDEALQRLEALDAQKGRVVELRYFGGMTIEETAEALGISPATIKREWTFARAWLRREIGQK